MSEQSTEIIRNQPTSLELAQANAAIAPLTAGGIIESAAGPITPRMDDIVQEHLTDVAIRTAGGDSKPERPTYIYNPASGLLIKFSFHREGPNKSYHGLFADVVELDSEGNARHGISTPDIRMALDPSCGFIPVNVGENKKGFTPSSIPLEYEKADKEVEEEITFPNIELATLAELLNNEPVDEDVSLKSFLKQRTERYTETETRVRRRFNNNYMDNDQAIGSSTNPNLHLVITDKEDTTEINRISRELGMFPVFLSIEVAHQGVDFREKFEGSPMITHFEDFFPPNEQWKATRNALKGHTPAFVTYDGKFMTGPDDPDGSISKKIWRVMSELGISKAGVFADEKPLRSRPVFRKILNCGLPFDPDEPDEIQKEAHGNYEMALEQSNPANMQAYADLLRKAKLDYALTQYLRGLDKL